MSNTIYVTLARQQNLRSEMDVVAQNIANASTTAYKSERLLFREALFEAADGSQISYVEEAGTARDHVQGRIERTGNDFDVAINGAGYFSIGAPDGTVYTRQGHFGLDAKGKLVTSSGLPVLNANNQPIVIPSNVTHITIGRDGTIGTDSGSLGRLQIVTFEDETKLTRLGEGNFGYSSDVPPPILRPEEANLQQGALEGSNVSPIIEMTRMIEIVRSYQSAQRMMDTDSELLSKAIQDLTSTK